MLAKLIPREGVLAIAKANARAECEYAETEEDRQAAEDDKDDMCEESKKIR